MPFIFPYVYHRSLLFVSSVSATVACRTGAFFFAFFGRAPRRRGGLTSAAGKSAEK